MISGRCLDPPWTPWILELLLDNSWGQSLGSGWRRGGCMVGGRVGLGVLGRGGAARWVVGSVGVWVVEWWGRGRGGK